MSHLLEKRAQGSFSKEKVLTDEYDLVHQALFTDPDDQSGWFYHLWLLEQTVKVESSLLVSTWPPHGSNLNVSADGFLDTCASSPITASKQFYCLSNVLLFSPASHSDKIGKLMLARLLTAHDAMMSYDKPPETCKMVHSEEVKQLYSDLMTLDPPRSQYYKDEYSLVVSKKISLTNYIVMFIGIINVLCENL
ncbi:hypothetical protein HYC85_023649 [Camellia sinensis]|uniref:Geranylgeranyl transferase type-2 subunit alpha n=1 Tax=Camellia sinensis TaxID=4442 RepID=A0A7J7GF73_CAMSI|nr:hypothetical protein HYC85_023649 [Camellia sinensis]